MARLTLIALTAFVYLGVATAGFVYDDAHWLSRVGVKAPTWSLPGRGLTEATYAGTAAVFGLEPVAFHVGNLLLHLCVGLAVYGLALRLTASRLAAIGAMATLLLHPLSSQAVNYVSARADLFATLFTVLAAWWALTMTARVAHWLVLGGLLGLALVSKESAVLAPMLVALTVLWQRPGTVISKGLWSIAWVVLGFMVGGYYGFLGERFGTGVVPFWESAQLNAVAIWTYAGMVVTFKGLTVDHDFTRVGPMLQLAALMGLAWVGTACIVFWHRWPVLTWAMAWTLVAVGPRVFVPMPEPLTESQWYAVLPAVSVLVGVIGARLWAWEPDEFWRVWRAQMRYVR